MGPGADRYKWGEIRGPLIKWPKISGVKLGVTWRIIPGRTDMWLITMVSNKSPKDRVVGALPYMAVLWLINGGDPNYLQVLG